MIRLSTQAVSRSLSLAGLATLLAVLGGLPAAAQDNRPRKLLFVFQPAGGQSLQIHTMNPDGSERARLTKGDTFEMDPAWSPDGKQVAFVAATDEAAKQIDLYVMNADGSGRKRLTNNGKAAPAIAPCWSPDGKRIFFTQMDMTKADAEPEGQIRVIDADGKNPKRVGDVTGIIPSVSPDGKLILYTAVAKDAALCVMNADGTAVRRLREKALMGSWSPDGKKIAYMGNPDDGQGSIFVANADGSDPKRLTSGKGLEFAPQWSPDGKQIYFSRMHMSAPGGAGIYVVDADGKNERGLSKAGSTEMFGGAVLMLGQHSEKAFTPLEK